MTTTVDRLSVADLMMLWPEAFGWREDIGAVAIVDGAPWLDGHGAFDLAAPLAAVAARLHRVPRLRQVLRTPRWGLGGPYWVDSPSFDPADHLRVQPLAGPTEDDLLAAVEDLRRRPFDRSRPLWEMWFLPGLTEGRTGLYMKVHHTIADGVAGIAVLGNLLDLEPTTPMAGPRWQPSVPPSGRKLVLDNLRRRLAEVREALAKVTHPITTTRQIGATMGSMRHNLGRGRAPVTSLNRPIGPDRRLALIRTDLQLDKAIAHAHGATVNDVLLAAVSGGLRALLSARGEPVDELVIRAMAPVSLHDEAAGHAEGNRDGSMFVPLPLRAASPASVLEDVARATAEAKRHVFVPPSGVVSRSRFLQRSMWRRFDRQRWTNLSVTNVPGPPVFLYLAGARLLELFPLAPLVGNVTLAVGALSYAGQLNVATVADADSCGDVSVFVDGFEATLAALAAPGGTALAGTVEVSRA